MIPTDKRQYILDLETILATIASTTSWRTCHEGSWTSFRISGKQRVIERDEYNRLIATASFEGRRESRELKAQLIHDPFREDKRVGIRDRIWVASSTLKGFCEAIATSKASQVD